MSHVSLALAPFGTTIFAEMTRLALTHGAVNLSQGFPDFDGPDLAKRGAIDAIGRGDNQYARTFGIPRLTRAVAERWKADTGRAIDPDASVTITSGCTEAIAAAMLGLVNPGDEVVMFEPFYDSYRACVAMAGAVPRVVTLRPDGRGGFAFDPSQLAAAFTGKTRAVLLNTPHNPTGKVFSRDELTMIASLAQKHGSIVLSDEVYDKLVYDAGQPHVSIATLDGMAERTVTLNSLGKSFSLTGWKVGWAIAPSELTAGVRASHQFLTFSTATPLQHGAAAILEAPGDSVARTVELFIRNRDILSACLKRAGFTVFDSPGTYFVMADHSAVSARLGVPGGDDRAFCKALIERCKVAAIPPSVFYQNTAEGTRFVRFAYCKKAEAIDEAVRRLDAGLR